MALKKKTVKAWTVIFADGYAQGEVTFWSNDVHPIFTQKKFARKWARELKENTNIPTHVVECTISYSLPLTKIKK
jgi:hypothetical protein